MGGRSSTLDDKVNEILLQLAQIPLVTQSVSSVEHCVQTVSASIVSGSLLDLGFYLDKVMAPQPRGPVTWARRKKAEIQDVDSTKVPSSDDGDARTAVLLRCLCAQCLPGMYACLKKTVDPTDQLERVHCKRGTRSAPIVSDTRANCADFVARIKDDGLPYPVYSPFCIATSTILVRQSRSPEWREIGRRVAPLWKVLATKLQDFSLNMTLKAHTLFQKN